MPVVGFSLIGQEFAQRTLVFGARLSFYGPFLPKGTDVPRPVRRKDDLAQAVSDADIASLHLPRAIQTTNLIDAGLLAWFRLGSVLINTGRGGVVDEPALAKALDAGRPAINATRALALRTRRRQQIAIATGGRHLHTPKRRDDAAACKPRGGRCGPECVRSC